MASIVIRNAPTVPKLQASRSRSIALSSIKSRRPQFRVSRPRLTVRAFTEEKAPGEAPMAAFANQLEALKAVSTVVADTGDINSVRKYAPVDCTTNPSLVLKAVQMPEYEYLLTNAIAEEKASGNAVDPERPFAGVADRLAVDMGCELLKIVPGRVSTEVDAHLSYDTEATVAKAKRLVQLYEEKGINARERVYIKIASTFEGIQACRQLQLEGIACNMTLLFSFGQAAACADAGASLISPFVGRILDWYKKAEGRDFAPEEDPGVVSVRRIYNYYKTHGYSTIVMAASFRNIGEIQQLAGCDNITISPALLEELGQSTEELPTMLLEAKAASSDPKYENIDLATFSKLHDTDTMAVEKLKEGIDNFAADQRKLEALLAELAK